MDPVASIGNLQMTEHIHDPVTALSEAAATGRTAEIFADIRDVMQLPLITSVWRSLAAVDNGLESVWEAVRPIMLSRQPDVALQELLSSTSLPVPNIQFADAASGIDLTTSDISSATVVADAYNRSNGLNLFAITALVGESSTQPSLGPVGVSHHAWPKLPVLLEKSEIDPETWALLEQIKLLGASEASPAIATLWRHLAHWPVLLKLIIRSYEPMHEDGSLETTISGVFDAVGEIASRIDASAVNSSRIPDDAMHMIQNYVNNPGAVNRMVALGHGVREWITSN